MNNRVVKHTLLTPNNNHMEEKKRKKREKKRGRTWGFYKVTIL
jgi:hypothetical protein